MKFIPPIAITDSILSSTNVSEDDYDEYSSVTTYATGDRVIVIATHKIYESLSDSNLDNYPPDNISGTSPAWLEVSYTNAWKMFGYKVGSQTSNTDTIEVELVSSNASHLTLLNLSGLEVNVTMTHSVDGEVLNETVSLLSTSNVFDGFSYCFAPFIYTKNVSFSLPIYSTATLAITITAASGELAKCGSCIIGQSVFIGCTNFGASVGITDYSVKTTDDFGDYEVLQRAFSKRGSFNVVVQNAKVDYVFNLLADYRSTPAVWLATDDEVLASPLTFLAFYKDFNVVVQYSTESLISIELEGLT